MTGIQILGTGSYLPECVVENQEFTTIVETSDEWISTRTGIKERHFAEETAWYMGAKAAERALAQAGMNASEVDLLILTTVTPDYITPSVSCMVQAEIGAENAMCLDINCACAAFAYAVDMAHRYLCCDDVKTVLVISSELLSRITNFEDRSTCVLFGDGAGAVLLKKGDGIFGAKVGADGTGAALMFGKRSYEPTPFAKRPLMEDEITRHPAKPGYLVMNGKEVYKFATKIMPLMLEQACEKAGITPAELDWIIPHHANERIVQTAMKKLDIPMEKTYMNIEKVGNTSSASIPIALDELVHSGKLKSGDKIGIVGFGAGLTYGAAVFEW